MVDGSSLLFGQVQRTDKIELMTTLPPKRQVDKLIHNFFDRDNFPITIVRKYIDSTATHRPESSLRGIAILHEPTFMTEVKTQMNMLIIHANNKIVYRTLERSNQNECHMARTALLYPEHQHARIPAIRRTAGLRRNVRILGPTLPTTHSTVLDYRRHGQMLALHY